MARSADFATDTGATTQVRGPGAERRRNDARNTERSSPERTRRVEYPCGVPTKRPMNGPSVISVSRIEPDLARRSWDRVRRLVAVDDPGDASNSLRCFIAVFGHGPGLPETIERVRRVLAVGKPDRLSRHIAVQAALSSDPDADTAGTLYVNWLFKPGTPTR